MKTKRLQVETIKLRDGRVVPLRAGWRAGHNGIKNKVLETLGASACFKVYAAITSYSYVDKKTGKREEEWWQSVDVTAALSHLGESTVKRERKRCRDLHLFWYRSESGDGRGNATVYRWSPPPGEPWEPVAKRVHAEPFSPGKRVQGRAVKGSTLDPHKEVGGRSLETKKSSGPSLSASPPPPTARTRAAAPPAPLEPSPALEAHKPPAALSSEQYVAAVTRSLGLPPGSVPVNELYIKHAMAKLGLSREAVVEHERALGHETEASLGDQVRAKLGLAPAGGEVDTATADPRHLWTVLKAHRHLAKPGFEQDFIENREKYELDGRTDWSANETRSLRNAARDVLKRREGI